MGGLTRRAVLAGGLALAACGAPQPRATTSSGPVVRGEFRSSRRLGATTRWAVTRPLGATGRLPLVVALHGHGGSVEQLMGPTLDLPGQVASTVAAGVAPFALAAVNGGTSFWHERPDGEDAGAMVVDELLPLLAARTDLEVDTDRVGLLGWSMGGYGVLHLAPLLGADRVAAVCASSPGLYTDPSRAHASGFVDAAEYERFSVMDAQADLAGIPVRIACGTDDYFFDAVSTYVDGFPADADLEVDFADGGHEVAFTLRSLPADLGFVASRLA